MNEFKKIVASISGVYPELLREYKTEKDLRILASFYNLGTVYPKMNSDILKLAMTAASRYEPKNLNDFYSILLASIQNVNGFKKTAYPQSPLVASENFDNEFDLGKWSSLVYKIYDAVLSKDMTLDNAIDYYSDTLNKKAEEDFKFKRWIRYYLDGENNKYSEMRSKLQKKSNFESGIGPANFYLPETRPMPQTEDIKAKRLLQNNIEEADAKHRAEEWREKLNSAIRRIDKLIRQTPGLIGGESAVELAQSLHEFDMRVRQINLHSTAVDLAYGAAGKFKKLGFAHAHELMLKTAQELESGPIEESAPIELPPEPIQDRKPLSSSDPVTRVYENTSGAKEGEYEKLDSPVDLSDAISKLEEIAARLSDRRVIRLLAEFDIMLDKIGIAAMFPELSESQSKLIDGYSYALVRVTKMLGMLSSGKNLGEIADAKKSEITSNIRKDVGKTFNREDDFEPEVPARGEEAIREEFEAPPVKPVIPKTQHIPGAPKV